MLLRPWTVGIRCENTNKGNVAEDAKILAQARQEEGQVGEGRGWLLGGWPNAAY